MRASSPGVRRWARIGSIPDEARGLWGILPLPQKLVTTLGHQDGVVLLMAQLGTTSADDEEGSAAAFFPEHSDRRRGESMRMAGELALGHHHAIVVPDDLLCAGRDPIDRTEQHITLSILPFHRVCSFW